MLFYINVQSRNSCHIREQNCIMVLDRLWQKKKLSILQLKQNANDRSIDYNIDSRLIDIIFSGDIGIAYINPIVTKFSTHYIIYNPEQVLYGYDS